MARHGVAVTPTMECAVIGLIRVLGIFQDAFVSKI
jgi:hypothetical protein